jgi:hypothetical protein
MGYEEFSQMCRVNENFNWILGRLMEMGAISYGQLNIWENIG